MAKISKDMIIADMVKLDPNIIPILMREGMHCVGCPSAQGESLGGSGYGSRTGSGCSGCKTEQFPGSITERRI